MKKILSFLYYFGSPFFFLHVFVYALYILFFLEDIAIALALILLVMICFAIWGVKYFIIEIENDTPQLEPKKATNKKKKNNIPKK